MRPFDLSLYLVTDRTLTRGYPLETVIEKALKGGVTMVQLREKEATSREFYELAVSIKRLLTPHGVPLIINDRLDIAWACNADGLHIGAQDIPYEVARRCLGKDKIIGLSVETVQGAMEANQMDVDYIGISPVFHTTTKTDTAPALGVEGIRKITACCVHPSVGIGGIHAGNAADVLRAGAHGIAVVSALMAAEDPEQAALTLREKLTVW